MSDFWLFVRVLFLVSCYTGLIFAPAVWAVVHHLCGKLDSNEQFAGVEENTVGKLQA